MIPILAVEHFVLNPSQKEDIEAQLAKLERVLPEEAQVRVFLALNKGCRYKALIKVHAFDQDLTGEESAYDLHTAVARACESLRHRVSNEKGRRLMRRKQYATAV